MQFKRSLVILAAAAVSTSLAACGGGDGENSSGRAEGVTGVPDGAPYVDQDGLRFHPTSLKVAASETVYFKNSESALHTVAINGKNESGAMKRDAIYTWTPAEPGEYKISCEFHPQMKATITVE